MIELGRGASRLAVGGQIQLTIPLNSAGKRRLRRLRSPIVTITTTITALNGATGATQPKSMQLRLPG